MESNNSHGVPGYSFDGEGETMRKVSKLEVLNSMTVSADAEQDLKDSFHLFARACRHQGRITPMEKNYGTLAPCTNGDLPQLVAYGRNCRLTSCPLLNKLQ